MDAAQQNLAQPSACSSCNLPQALQFAQTRNPPLYGDNAEPFAATVDVLHNMVYDYGQGLVQAVTGVDLSFTLAPGNQGARIKSSWASKSAWACADIKTPPGVTPGAIFSFYASSGEPNDRTSEKWDELDFEFLLSTPNKLWLNTWHDGAAVPGQEGFQLLWFAANGGFHRYCLDWDLAAQKAKWTVDGKEFRTYAMQGWTKPLTLYLSIWGQSSDWAGLSSFSGSSTVQVRNVAYKIRA